MTTTTLSKWGNGQGVRIPKYICDAIGAKVGMAAVLDIDEAEGSVILRFQDESAKFRRRSKKTLQELAGQWAGEKAGSEWGGPDVRFEVVE